MLNVCYTRAHVHRGEYRLAITSTGTVDEISCTRTCVHATGAVSTFNRRIKSATTRGLKLLHKRRILRSCEIASSRNPYRATPISEIIIRGRKKAVEIRRDLNEKKNIYIYTLVATNVVGEETRRATFRSKSKTNRSDFSLRDN